MFYFLSFIYYLHWAAIHSTTIQSYRHQLPSSIFSRPVSFLSSSNSRVRLSLFLSFVINNSHNLLSLATHSYVLFAFNASHHILSNSSSINACPGHFHFHRSCSRRRVFYSCSDRQPPLPPSSSPKPLLKQI